MSLPHCVSGGGSDACADLLFPHNTTIWYDNDDDDNTGDDDEVSFLSLSPTAFAHPVPASHD
jgi:hypothetical protein